MTRIDTPRGPGRNVAYLRKARGLNQAILARRAGISLSALSKIEIGDRTLSQGVAAALADAMGCTLDEVLGAAPSAQHEEIRLQDLRAVIRRFDLPGEKPTPEQVVALPADLATLNARRGNADLNGVLKLLPSLLGRATNHAHDQDASADWAAVAEVYGAVYWLAARHRWMDLATLAVARQREVAQRADPLSRAVAARDEAGTFLNSGDFDGGLAVIDRAIVRAEAALTGRDLALALGVLHLRGLTLAGRKNDTGEADRHSRAAWHRAEQVPADANVHGLTFGPENTAAHALATAVDLGRHREALTIAERLADGTTTLPPTRIGPNHLNVARAKLALKDRDGALRALVQAWDVAPQMARVHPSSQELMRVLISLHRRRNPELSKLAKRAGVEL